jgi:hypothetical protein
LDQAAGILAATASDPIVVLSPFLDPHLSLSERVEHLAVQQLIAQLSR